MDCSLGATEASPFTYMCDQSLTCCFNILQGTADKTHEHWGTVGHQQSSLSSRH